MISIKDLFFAYNQGELHEKLVLKNINFDINDGEFVILGGNNGSGKTTLLNLISSNSYPHIGTVTIDGESANQNSKSLVSYIREDISYYLAKDMSIIEQLLINSFKINKFFCFSYFKKDKVQDIINFVKSFDLGLDIEHILNKQLTEIPKYYTYVVAILVAAIKSPKILLIDDIWNQLDFEEIKSIFAVLQKIVDKLKCSVILAVSNPFVASMIRGRVIVIGNCSIIYDSKTVEEIDPVKMLNLFNDSIKKSYSENNDITQFNQSKIDDHVIKSDLVEAPSQKQDEMNSSDTKNDEKNQKGNN